MKRFVCREIIPGCAEVITGPSDQSVLDQVISHVAVDHGLVKPPLALVELVVATTQTLPPSRSRSHLRLVGAPTDAHTPGSRATAAGTNDSQPPVDIRAGRRGPSSAQLGVLPTAADRFPVESSTAATRSLPPVERLAAAVAAHQEYRHECLLYRGPEAFTAAVVPFVRDGLALGQPVMVAVAEPRLQALRDALGDDAHRVIFADMSELGRNPARLIQACLEFTSRTAGQPVRGVGEPIWAGRSGAELVECQLHEALMNVAIDLATPLWLICPYDVQALDDGVIAEALRSHPTLVESPDSTTSRFYAGAQHAAALFAAALPQPEPPVRTITFDQRRADMVAGRILQYARAAGMPAQRSAKLAAAADEVARAGLGSAGGVQIRLWQQNDSVVCEVGDRGEIDDPLIGRSAGFGPHGRERGIRLANELCDLVQVRSNRSGTAVRLHSRI